MNKKEYNKLINHLANITAELDAINNDESIRCAYYDAIRGQLEEMDEIMGNLCTMFTDQWAKDRGIECPVQDKSCPFYNLDGYCCLDDPAETCNNCVQYYKSK